MDTHLTKYAHTTFKAHFDSNTVESTREITFTIAAESTGKAHRNKFVYNWSNWQLDNYNANGVVFYQHQGYGDDFFIKSEPDDVIAKAEAWIDTFQGQKVLMSKAVFEPQELNATADKVFRKIIFGSLRSASTGVMPTGKIDLQTTKNSDNEIVDYHLNFPGQELLEWSVVHIPADPKALKKSMQSRFIHELLGDLKIKNISEIRVQELLDAIEKQYQAAPLEQLELELSGPDPNLDKYIQTLNRIKNGQAKNS